MIFKFDEVATFDEEGRLEGMQIEGRARRIQAWKEKKDDEEFDRLIARLKAKNHYQAWFERNKHDASVIARLRGHARRYYRRNADALNAAARRRRREKAAQVVNQCEECGHSFTLPFGFKRRLRAKYCSDRCRNRVKKRNYKARIAMNKTNYEH